MHVRHLSPTFSFLLVLYVCTTYQPHGPHLTDVTHVRPSPRHSTLHEFNDQGATPSPFETPIHDVERHQISWLSFLLDRRFRSNRDLETWGSIAQRSPPLRSQYPNSRDDQMTYTKHNQWFTLILDPKLMGSSPSNHLATLQDPTTLATLALPSRRPLTIHTTPFLRDLPEVKIRVPSSGYDVPDLFLFLVHFPTCV
jgi:hypothetical protein